MSQKLSNILSLIEIAENNLKNAQTLLKQLAQEKGYKPVLGMKPTTRPVTSSENDALEVVEGYFDGENMIGDNGQMYPVPQNYASKSQLIIGDRMKWMLTAEREIFKLIQPAPRERITGTFSIEGDNYVVLVDTFAEPIKILKASATYAMKNLGLQVGDEVVVIIPQGVTPTWGAFSSVTKSQNQDGNDKLEQLKQLNPVYTSQEETFSSQPETADLDDLEEYTDNSTAFVADDTKANDYF